MLQGNIRKGGEEMRKFLLPAIVGFSFLLGTALARYSRAAETTQTIEGTTPQVLVQEIRALRQSLQNFALGNSRLQVAIERCRVQQFLVERLNDEFNSIQSQIDANDSLIQQLEDTVKALDRSLVTETEATRREGIEQERKSVLANIELNKQRNQRLHTRSMQINDSLQTEKARLNQLRDNLDSLEHSLSNEQPSHK